MTGPSVKSAGNASVNARIALVCSSWLKSIGVVPAKGISKESSACRRRRAAVGCRYRQRSERSLDRWAGTSGNSSGEPNPDTSPIRSRVQAVS